MPRIATAEEVQATRDAYNAVEPKALKLALETADHDTEMVIQLSQAISLRRIADAPGGDHTDAAFDLGRAFAKGMEQGRREADPLVVCPNCHMTLSR